MKVADADKITIEWILANVNLEQARSNYEPMPRPNSQVRHKFEMPILGTWRVNDWNEVEVLIEIPVADFKPSEQEWDWLYVIRRPSFSFSGSEMATRPRPSQLSGATGAT